MNNAKLYKQDMASSLTSAGISIIGAFGIIYLLGTEIYAIALACGVALFGIYGMISKKNNYFELEGETLRYFEKNNLKYEWDLNKVGINYNVRKQRRNADEAEFVFDDGTTQTKIRADHIKHEELYNDIQALRGTKVLDFDDTPTIEF